MLLERQIEGSQMKDLNSLKAFSYSEGFDGTRQGNTGRWELALKTLVPACVALMHQAGPYTLLCSQHNHASRAAFWCSCFVPNNSISPGLTLLSLKNTSLHHVDTPRGTVLRPLIKWEVKNCELELGAESSKKWHWKARTAFQDLEVSGIFD